MPSAYITVLFSKGSYQEFRSTYFPSFGELRGTEFYMWEYTKLYIVVDIRFTPNNVILQHFNKIVFYYIHANNQNFKVGLYLCIYV